MSSPTGGGRRDGEVLSTGFMILVVMGLVILFSPFLMWFLEYWLLSLFNNWIWHVFVLSIIYDIYGILLWQVEKNEDKIAKKLKVEEDAVGFWFGINIITALMTAPVPAYLKVLKDIFILLHIPVPTMLKGV